MSSNLIFETLNDEHLSGALRMSSDVGWPHRKEDWAFVLSISNGVVATDGDRVVATALATLFPPVGMVNMIIVDAAFRGCGLGRDVMCRAMGKIAPDVWRLVSTKDGLPLYEKAGFHVTGEILQHQGLVKPISPVGSAEWATADNVRAMAALDAATTGMDRHMLYAALSDKARFAVLHNETGITGFAAVRDFGRGEVAGPVIAHNQEDAQSLLSLIMAERTGQLLRVDTSIETGLGPWLAAHGLPHVGGGLQMQKGELPQSPSCVHTVFALTSQALG